MSRKLPVAQQQERETLRKENEKLRGLNQDQLDLMRELYEDREFRQAARLSESKLNEAAKRRAMDSLPNGITQHGVRC